REIRSDETTAKRSPILIYQFRTMARNQNAQ
ncbi:MAG: hypothetical protein ACJAVK_001794, partial [Akkermansiaceae bacterium]